MTLYMTERFVADFDSAFRWYAETLGLELELRDDSGKFALFKTQTGRLAIKEKPGFLGVKLHFLVSDLAASVEEVRLRGGRILKEPAPSAENTSRATIAGPEGEEITLFSWTEHQE